MSYYLIVLLIVQALTEFLPVSSSGHLILVNRYFGVTELNTGIHAVLHLGTLLSLLAYFFPYFCEEIKKGWRSELWMIALASIPAIIVGFLIKHYHIQFYNTMYWVGIGLAAGALILYAADYGCEETRTKIGWKGSLFVGLFQCLAFFPGMSRMAMTLTGARFLSVERVKATQFSLLMSIPTVAGAVALSFNEGITAFDSISTFVLVMLLEAVIGYFLLMGIFWFAKRYSYLLCVVYRIFIAACLTKE